MSQVLEKLHKVDPNDSDAVKESINGFFQNVDKHTEVDCKVWLRELEMVITRFPRQCAPHRAAAARVLARSVGAARAAGAAQAARAAHALLQVRPSSDKAWSARAAWRHQLAALTAAAHSLLERTHTPPGAPHTPPGAPHTPPGAPAPPWATECALWAALRDLCSHDDVTRTTLGLRNVLLFIQAMLVEVYPVSKPLQPRAVLDVVVRVVAVSSAGPGDLLLLRYALNTLDALVACMGSNLIPWAAVVERCVLQALRWSGACGGHDAGQARCAAYTCATRWLSVAGGGAGVLQLCAHLATDLAPHAPATVSHPHNNKLSKKARRRLAASHGQRTADQGSRATHVEHDEQLVLCALQCAALVLAECAPAHAQVLLPRLLQRARSLRAASGASAAGLLRALHAGRHLGLHTHLLLHLYHTHQHHAHAQVRTFCSQGLLELKLQLHGAPASLNFGPEQTTRARSSVSKAHSLSRNNRAALNSLLGKHTRDSSPKAPWSDDVITIGGVPSSKRPRLDSQLITENISVSSDSVESLDSTDDDDVIVNEDRGARQLARDDAVLSNIVAHNIEGTDGRCEQAEERDGAGISKVSTECEQALDARAPLTNIYEANTQIPLNTSTDQETLEDDESPVSMEIVYDPNIENKVTILERTEDDTLPSTNDTDDVHITCGQLVRNSQELNLDINKASEEIAKVNGVGGRDMVGDEDNGEVVDYIEAHSNSKEITVDDMLADFVDEPNQVHQIEA